MTYRESLTQAMDEFAADRYARFIGYGVRHGGRAAGTLQNVAEDKLIETPVAENLMAGIACGLSIRGFKPLVYIERMDFILNALDAIVNHLDKIALLSKGQYHPTALIRVVVGNREKPLFTGATHIQDFTVAMKSMVSFRVVRLRSPKDVLHSYRTAAARLGRESTMLVEYKDLL